METNKKISEICKKFCKTTEIKISYSMTKIGDYFSIKSRIPEYIKSFVVNYCVRASCKASYVGETTRRARPFIQMKWGFYCFQPFATKSRSSDKW